MKIHVVIVALFLVFGVSYATYGVDVSTLLSESEFQCLKTHNLSFAIVRCWHSSGTPDPNCPTTISNAWKGGMRHVDGYLFPCFKCGNPETQMKDTVKHMSSVKYGMIWLDIEDAALWGSIAENQKFLQAMISEAEKLGVSLGIYANWNSWRELMGEATFAHKYPLWYPHYDNNPSFRDFENFGGWSRPSMKQFRGTTTLCNAGIDTNFY